MDVAGWAFLLEICNVFTYVAWAILGGWERELDVSSLQDISRSEYLGKQISLNEVILNSIYSTCSLPISYLREGDSSPFNIPSTLLRYSTQSFIMGKNRWFRD